jgi:hypothetical protein
MGKSQREKGKRGEREVATMFRERGWDVRRGWQSRAGTDQCDVENTPLWIEVKRGKRCSVPAAMRQALADTDGRTPVVFTRDDGGPALMTVLAEDGLNMLTSAHNWRTYVALLESGEDVPLLGWKAVKWRGGEEDE